MVIWWDNRFWAKEEKFPEWAAWHPSEILIIQHIMLYYEHITHSEYSVYSPFRLAGLISHWNYWKKLFTVKEMLDFDQLPSLKASNVRVQSLTKNKTLTVVEWICSIKLMVLFSASFLSYQPMVYSSSTRWHPPWLCGLWLCMWWNTAAGVWRDGRIWQIQQRLVWAAGQWFHSNGSARWYQMFTGIRCFWTSNTPDPGEKVCDFHLSIFPNILEMLCISKRETITY